ncbi:MAG: cupin domain-containing protein [Halioglobus sp.]
MINESMSIIRDGKQDYLPIPLPGSEGVYVKVLKADVEMDRVVVKIKFDRGTRMPRHIHHCRAIAYTISGSWAYDEGSFIAGETAWEDEGNDHTPWSDEGAELFIVFDGKDGRYLDNFLEDGTVIKLDMPFLKAFEGLSLEEAAKVDVLSLVEIIPPPA